MFAHRTRFPVRFYCPPGECWCVCNAVVINITHEYDVRMEAWLKQFRASTEEHKKKERIIKKRERCAYEYFSIVAGFFFAPLICLLYGQEFL